MPATGADAATARPAGGDATGPGRAGGPRGGTRPGPDGSAPRHGGVARRTAPTRWPEDDPPPWPALPGAGPTGTGDAPAAATPRPGPVGADPWPALPDDGAWRRPTGTARDDARDARLDAEQRGY
ncbi:hypothetical protein [Micromonospora wenchangensis]|uniref:hypothetical protein n=1 Tax=Micromonospora wenchangensis TaxID=1185415 RepID=UPI003826AAF3